MADLQVGSRLDASQLVGKGEHGGAVLQQLVQHKVQQGGLAVCALHICQLEQGVQLEACRSLNMWMHGLALLLKECCALQLSMTTNANPVNRYFQV